MKVMIFLLLLLHLRGVYPICRHIDDILVPDYGGYITQYSCEDVDLKEFQSFIASEIKWNGINFFIEDSKIESIKADLMDNTAKFVITFRCINCHIKEIEKEGLKELVELSNLTLVGNDFGTFDGTFLSENKKFQHLNLTGNNIKKVENICQGPPTMKTIVLRNNPIENLEPNTFKWCKNLQHLDISNTSIKLTRMMFQVNSKLEELHLSNLKLQLEDFYLYVPNLTYLDLSENDLTTLDMKLFDFYKNLKILDLTGNKIGSIRRHGEETSPLRQLFLKRNNLKNLSSINLDVFKDIQGLDLSYNQIEEVPLHFFEHSTQLRHLNLAHNQIKKLSVGTFSPSGNLVHLDLSYNNIASLQDELYHTLPNLEEFHISGNNLSSFDYYALIFLEGTLKILGAADLKLSCKQLAYIIKYCERNDIQIVGNRNFQTSNIDGISCSENSTKNEREDWGTQYINLTSYNLVKQNDLLRHHLDKFGDIFVVFLLLTILLFILISFQVILPVTFNFYGRYKKVPSSNRNGSHIELVQENV